MPKRKPDKRQVVTLLTLSWSRRRGAEEGYPKSSGKALVIDAALWLIRPGIEPSRHQAVEREINDRPYTKGRDQLRATD
jgi:hypothetical protein